MTSSADHAATVRDDKGYSEETCVRCGWRMGSPALNCQNDDTPHVFPSQVALADRATELEAEVNRLTDGIAADMKALRAAEARATELEREVIEADTHAGEWVQRAERAETALRAFEWLDKKKHDRHTEAWLAFFDEAMADARAALGETAP